MVVTDMRKVYVFFICFLLVAVSAGSVLAQVTARIDREKMAIDETLTLTIIKDGTSFFSDPDLALLEKDFKVLGQSQNSTTRIINGSASSSVEWRVSLSPRRTGKLEIPPISVGKEQSNSLTVEVSDAAQPSTSVEGVPIFIETEVDADSVYVQSQLILTFRLFWAIEARITEPSDPEVEDVLVKRLDDATFDKMINGQTYRVFERKYAVFPQKSGTLEIPPIVVDVTIPTRQRSRSFFDSFTTMGEKTKLRSEGEKITVREKLPDYPASAVWLPTSQLILKEEWNRDPQDLNVGESSTITLAVTAEGLVGEQLPPIELLEPNGLKLYQGKADVENHVTANGINGLRKESIALIPTQPGTFELPEIRIPWWNKNLDKIEYAVVPAKQLVVKESPADQERRERVSGPVMKLPQDIPANSLQQPVSQAKPTAWIIICSLLAIGWIITLYLLIHTRRQGTPPDKTRKQKLQDEPVRKEKEAFELLSKSCHQNDPAHARKAVLVWIKTFCPEAKIQTFSDVERALPDLDFIVQLRKLDRVLYNPAESEEQWQGSSLLEQVKKLRGARKKTTKEKIPLEKLYK